MMIRAGKSFTSYWVIGMIRPQKTEEQEADFKITNKLSLGLVSKRSPSGFLSSDLQAIDF